MWLSFSGFECVHMNRKERLQNGIHHYVDIANTGKCFIAMASAFYRYVAERLDVPVEMVTFSTDMGDDLGTDAIDIIELLRQCHLCVSNALQ